MSPKMCTQQCCTHQFSFRMLKDSPSYGKLISWKGTANAFTVEHDLWTECGTASAVLSKTLQPKWRENAVGALYMVFGTAVLQCFLEKKCCKQMLLLLRNEVLIAHFIQVLCPAELKPRSEVGSMQKYFECQNALQNGLQTAAVTVYVEHWTAVRGAFWGNNAANSSCWRFEVKSYSITSCKSSIQMNTNRGPKYVLYKSILNAKIHCRKALQRHKNAESPPSGLTGEEKSAKIEH